jgi:hypothetical protein
MLQLLIGPSRVGRTIGTRTSTHLHTARGNVDGFPDQTSSGTLGKTMTAAMPTRRPRQITPTDVRNNGVRQPGWCAGRRLRAGSDDGHDSASRPRRSRHTCLCCAAASLTRAGFPPAEDPTSRPATSRCTPPSGASPSSSTERSSTTSSSGRSSRIDGTFARTRTPRSSSRSTSAGARAHARTAQWHVAIRSRTRAAASSTCSAIVSASSRLLGAARDDCAVCVRSEGVSGASCVSRRDRSDRGR